MKTMRSGIRRLMRLVRLGRSRMPGEEGQALVEFALVAPILILLVVGVFEFARAWQAYQALTDAAREVARNAVVDRHICDYDPAPGFCPADTDNLPAVLQNLANFRVSASGLEYTDMTLDVTPDDPSSGSIAGDPVTVNMELDYRFVFVGALLGWATGDRTITLKTEFVMRKE